MSSALLPDRPLAKPLNPSIYEIEPEQAAFLKAQTGIISDEDLKEHILAVQAKAYQVVPFSCIRLFSFIRSMIARMPVYEQVLKLSKERECAVLLDLGCCFGMESRRAVADGWPGSNVVAVDLHPEFIDLGHDLAKSTPETCPIKFLSGDLFDLSFLEARDITLPNAPSDPIPDLKLLTSLNELHGHVSAIYISAVFHPYSIYSKRRSRSSLPAVSFLCYPLYPDQ